VIELSKKIEYYELLMKKIDDDDINSKLSKDYVDTMID